MSEIDTLDTLKLENARLVVLLEANDIEWRLPVKSNTTATIDQQSSTLSTADKIALFKRLFRGRSDIYPLRWESKIVSKCLGTVVQDNFNDLAMELIPSRLTT